MKSNAMNLNFLPAVPVAACAAMMVASSVHAQLPPDVWAVDQAAPGPAHDGGSWETAFPDLQDALSNLDLEPGDQIWVAAGTYIPSAPYCPDCDPGVITDRHNTFLLIDGVGIYGGFLGNADPGGGETQLSQRDPETNITTLSGGNPDFPFDNSYSVVTADGVGPSALLNGFTITVGWANGSGSPPGRSSAVGCSATLEQAPQWFVAGSC